MRRFTIVVSVIYLLGFFAALSSFTVALLEGTLPDFLLPYKLFVASALAGGFGGVVYCMRGVYQAVSAEKNWDSDWFVWYILRPVNSVVMGGVSYIVLKAGLLVLEATPEEGGSPFGYLALAFVAGFNVSKFLRKIEDVAKSIWGIEKSGSQGNSQIPTNGKKPS